MAAAEAKRRERQLVNRIIAEGELVFSHDWDTGGPGGGAGSECVYLLDGQFALSSADFGNYGPYASLLEAAEAHELFAVTDATTKLKCTALSANDLAQRLTCTETDKNVRINGQRWVYDGESFNLVQSIGEKT